MKLALGRKGQAKSYNIISKLLEDSKCYVNKYLGYKCYRGRKKNGVQSGMCEYGRAVSSVKQSGYNGSN